MGQRFERVPPCDGVAFDGHDCTADRLAIRPEFGLEMQGQRLCRGRPHGQGEAAQTRDDSGTVVQKVSPTAVSTVARVPGV